MNAVAIGPLVFAPDRFAAILAIAAFLILSEVLSRKVDARFSAWAWGTTIAFIVGARLGHVLSYAESFLAEPWRVFAVWQGGFLVEAGLGVAVLFTAFRFRHHLRLVPWTVLPAAAAAYMAVLVIQLTAGTPQTALPSDGGYFTLAGEPFQPRELEGRPAVVNLWATWCPPCRREMPMMVDVAENNDDAVFVFVNQGEGRETIERYLTSENLRLDHIIVDSLGEFGRHYAARGLPATLFIGPDGLLRSMHLGEISREALLGGIEELE
ncbi:TlpA disulfide reductase family protein [Afifella pfennigii]|uniref:TlpA disulfide reductase family protein n=1 Tax=Afifella pfennigii TaxID=209897 RepID=UPI00047AF1F5|nr:TlpA disulfide reductase family protein [Afifella pfennigii]